LFSAVEIVFDRSLRQRCVIHRARNILAKVPAHAQRRSRPTTGRSSSLPDGTVAGEAAVAEASRRARAFASKWRNL
jgi:transposase-like protein